MNSFITGSRAYGTPREDSDIDLVIRISEKDALMILDNCDEPPRNALIEHYGLSGLHCIRYGKLNVLMCTSDIYFDAWRMGTHLCAKKGQLSHDEAVEIFQKVFQEAGLQ